MNRIITLTAFLVLTTVFVFGQKTQIKTYDDFRQSEIETSFNQDNHSIEYPRFYQINKNKLRNADIKSTLDIKQALISMAIQYWDETTSQWMTFEDPYEYIYDDYGNMTQMIFSVWWIYFKFECTYDSNNNMTQTLAYIWDETTSQWLIMAKQDFTYDENGNITQVLDYTWDETNNLWVINEKGDFTYDENENIAQILNYTWDETNNQWEYLWKEEFSYDANHNIMQQIRFDWLGDQWIPYYKYENTYNANENIIQGLRFEWFGQWVSTEKIEYLYDAYGNKAQSFNYYWDNINSQWDIYGQYEYTYNNSFSYTDLILPIDVDITDFNHMLTSRIVYSWDEDASDWVYETKNTYYYSEHEITSVPEIAGEDLKVYPNPFSEYVTFSIPDTPDQFTFKLFDLQGRKIMSKEIRSDEKINMQDLNQGIYFYNLIIDDKKLTGKLIKS